MCVCVYVCVLVSVRDKKRKGYVAREKGIESPMVCMCEGKRGKCVFLLGKETTEGQDVLGEKSRVRIVSGSGWK